MFDDFLSFKTGVQKKNCCKIFYIDKFLNVISFTRLIWITIFLLFLSDLRKYFFMKDKLLCKTDQVYPFY